MAKPNSKRVTTADLYAALDEIAPFAHAADWDNVGLLAGWMDSPVRAGLLAIDVTDGVADEAIRKRVDVLIAYHPPIFKGIHSVTADAAAPTRLLPDLLAARISIIALHTALDVAVGGTNDVLLDAFELRARYPLEDPLTATRTYKLVVFVPPAEVDALRGALASAGAGVIGHYDNCSYELAGRGTFRGDESTNPTVGRKLRLEYADETRLEMVVPQRQLGPVIRALYANHSYEEPAFDVYPLHQPVGRGQVGLGRVGVLKKPTRGSRLMHQLAPRVDLSAATVVGSLARPFQRVVAAAGAFGVDSFRDPDTLVLTGEFKHHDALALERRGVTAVHIGHYASERPMLNVLRQKLAARFRGARFSIARSGRSPLKPLSH